MLFNSSISFPLLTPELLRTNCVCPYVCPCCISREGAWHLPGRRSGVRAPAWYPRRVTDMRCSGTAAATPVPRHHCLLLQRSRAWAQVVSAEEVPSTWLEPSQKTSLLPWASSQLNTIPTSMDYLIKNADHFQGEKKGRANVINGLRPLNSQVICTREKMRKGQWVVCK